ncbi:MAG: T9SS type A sorting domain-containing protein [Flavobacteriales bacterium]
MTMFLLPLTQMGIWFTLVIIVTGVIRVFYYLVFTQMEQSLGNAAVFSVYTFAWWIKTNMLGQTVNKWIPAPPSQLKTAYSLYVKDNSVTGIDENELDLGVNIYPNPTNNQITIDFNLLDATEVSFEIFDATGRVVALHNLGNLPNGLYLCNIKAGETVISKRIIKN